MRYKWLEEYLLEKPGITKDFKAEWNWERFLLDGKMVAAICLGDDGKAVYITVKLEPLHGEPLRKEYGDVIPGYYMNKLHWNSVRPDGAVPDGVLKEMLDESYRLILHSLSKKRQRELYPEIFPKKGERE